MAVAEVDGVLDEMERDGWITRSNAWFGNDPETGVTVITLTSAGKHEAERRQVRSGALGEPIVLTRDELIEELRRFGLTDEQAALNPHLRADRYHFWPSISAWSQITD